MKRIQLYLYGIAMSLPYILMILFPALFGQLIGDGKWLYSLSLLMLAGCSLIFAVKVNAELSGSVRRIFFVMLLILNIICILLIHFYGDKYRAVKICLIAMVVFAIFLDHWQKKCVKNIKEGAGETPHQTT